jgi:RHS repeat-associated protein
MSPAQQRAHRSITAASWQPLRLDEVLARTDALGGSTWSPTAITSRAGRAEGEGRNYFNARYYDPALGRFLTEDPARKGTAYYTYVENNPLNRIDPSGLQSPEEDAERSQKLGPDVGKYQHSEWPLASAGVTSAFGSRDPVLTGYSPGYEGTTPVARPEYTTAYHGGYDLAAASGAKVGSTTAGVVTAAVMGDKTYGNFVMVKISDAAEVMMAHLSSIAVKQGATVSAGQTLGTVGSTGASTGPHLHMEYRDPRTGEAFDPVAAGYLSAVPKSYSVGAGIVSGLGGLRNVVNPDWAPAPPVPLYGSGGAAALRAF